MGTRVVVAITNPIKGEDDTIFWCNTTSFNVLSKTEDIAYECKNLDELVQKLKDFNSYSKIRGESEKYFGEDSVDNYGNQFEYPFGDYEYIVYVDDDLKVSRLSTKLYCLIKGKTKEELLNYNYGR